MNGVMAPFISETYNLSPTEKGAMLSVPIFASALMRYPPGVLDQYIGRKNATLVEMGLIMVTLLFGYFFVNSYSSLLAMGLVGGRQRGHRCFGAGGTSAGTTFRHSRSLRVMLCFAALGAGNGALFQLMSLR